MSARCACRGSFQFLNLTTLLMANVVALVKLAISFVVFKPVHNQCIYIHDITRQCVHNNHNCVILLFVKNSTGYSVKIYVLCVFCRLSNFYWIVSQNM